MIENRKVFQDLLFSDAVEGGWSPPRDGDRFATNYGITFPVFQAYSAPDEVTVEDLKKMTVETAKIICTNNFWLPVRGNSLPGGLDVITADFAFNSGPQQAVRTLQRCLGFTGEDVDGFIGDATMRAIQCTPPAVLIESYCDARLLFMQKLKNFEQNKNGWRTRVERMRELALHLAPAEATTVTAKETVGKVKFVSKAAIVGVVITSIEPMVESIPEAKVAYASVVELFGPYAIAMPWLIPVVGGITIVGILYVKGRAKRLARAAITTGAAGVAVS